MKNSDWGMEIIRVGNGYKLRMAGDAELIMEAVVEDAEDDELKAGEELLWTVMEHFGFGGSRHDKERITITREPGEKYKG